MNETLRWLATIGAALIALAVCVTVVWLVAPWDLVTRVAIGTSGGLVVGAVIALWGAAAVDRAARRAESSAGAGGSPGDRAPAEPGTVTAVVAAFHETVPPGGWPMTSPTRYEGSLTAGRLEIRPAHPYLDLVQSGGELTLLGPGEDSWTEDTQAAQLDIKVVNNTHETVVVHQVRLDVARSLPRLHCVPFVQEGEVELRPELYVRGPIRFGPRWPSSGPRGRFSRVTLRFHLEHPNRPGALTSEYSWKDYDVTSFRAAEGKENEDHPLIRALAEAGARPVEDEQSARRIYESRDPWHNHIFHSRYWEVGPFDGDQAMMVGAVSYAETGADDMKRSYSYRFRAPIDLTIYYPFSSPIMAQSMGISFTYVASVLRSEGADYVVEVPVSHSLAPGEADRLLVALPAEASTHDFRVSLLCSNGSVDCGAVHLETFRTLGELVPLAEGA